MGYAELIQRRLKTLPPEKQAEIYDFVEFIATRGSDVVARPDPRGDWSEAEFSQLSLAQAMRGMEDDPVVYSLDDVKERWQ